MRHAVRNRNELDIEHADHATLAVFDHDEFGLAEQASFFNAVASETKRDGRAVDGEAQFAQQVLQGAHVIFVTMRGNTANNAAGVLTQPREIGKHEIDAMHVGIGKHQPTVDHQQLVVLFDDHAVAADLTETAEEVDLDWRSRIRFAHELTTWL